MSETDAWVGLRAHYPLNGVPATSVADANFGPWVRSWRESMCRSLQWVKHGRNGSDWFAAPLTGIGTAGNGNILAGSFNLCHATNR